MILNIILWFFLILFLLIAIVIFVPICYKLEGSFGQQTEFNAKVNWFLFRLKYDYGSAGSVFKMKIGPYVLPDEKLKENRLKKRLKKKLKKKQKEKKKGKLHFKLVDTKSALSNLDIKTIVSLGIILAKRLLKCLAPRFFKVQGVVGFEDPCNTGQFIGLYEAFACAAGVRRAIDIQGNFSQKAFEADIKIAGRFAIASLLRHMLWFIFQKPIWSAIFGKSTKERGRTE